jgi:hypothetical protein
MMRRTLMAVSIFLLCALFGHDALMAAQAALPEPHHAVAVAWSAHTPSDSHEAPVPHPESCDTGLRAVPQPTAAPPPAALPCVLPVRQGSSTVRDRPGRLDLLPTQPSTVRRAMLQVYRL